MQICECADVFNMASAFLFLGDSRNAYLALDYPNLDMRPIIILIISLLFFGCKKAVNRDNGIAKIEFARSGAWSDWGVSISIDSSLNYKYWGDYQTEKQKYFVGKISQAFWDTLNLKLEQVEFKTVKPRIIDGCVDCEYYELIIHGERGTTRILRSGTGTNDSVIQLCKWLGDKRNIPKLKQVKDSIKFEDSTHFTAKPRIKSIKFPPPILK